MTDDTLTRLRRVNPVPRTPASPPVDRVLALIASAEAEPVPRPRARRRWAGALVPSLGVALAVAVAVLALIAVGHGSHHRTGVAGTHRSTSGHASAVPSRPVVSLPAGGMPGVVQLWGSTMSSGGAGIVSFEQCNPCGSNQPGATQRFAEWSAETTDAGASWRVVPRPFYLFDPQFAGGRDVWADGQSRGTIVNGVWVSHDAGRTWTQAPLPVSSNEPGSVSARDGEVWAAAPQCASSCRVLILHGSARAGGTLQPTRLQPARSSDQASIVAATPGSAYLEVLHNRSASHYATHDGGRTWSVTGTACNGGFADAALAADGPSSLWEQCPGAHGSFLLAHSTDGGRTWTTHRLPFGVGGLFELRPVGGVVWGITDTGIVLRTADAGVTWHAVLRSGASGGHAVLIVADPSTAVVVRAIGRGQVQHHAANTNLIAYRTSDGGAHWMGAAIALPAR